MTPEQRGAIALDRTKGFFSVAADPNGKRAWTVFYGSISLAANNESLKDILYVAQENFGTVTLPVWDGDEGEYTSELLADPNY